MLRQGSACARGGRGTCWGPACCVLGRGGLLCNAGAPLQPFPLPPEGAPCSNNRRCCFRHFQCLCRCSHGGRTITPPLGIRAPYTPHTPYRPASNTIADHGFPVIPLPSVAHCEQKQAAQQCIFEAQKAISMGVSRSHVLKGWLGGWGAKSGRTVIRIPKIPSPGPNHRKNLILTTRKWNCLIPRFQKWRKRHLMLF